jgi:tyrosinase
MSVTRHNVLKNDLARANFIEGVHRLKRERKADQPSTYDSLVVWHHSSMHRRTPPGNSEGRNAAHGGPVFLPWHRFFLILLEQHIQRVLGDSTFGLPYWDWAEDGQLDMNDQPLAPLWTDRYMGPLQSPVTSGPFSEKQWRLSVEGARTGRLRTVDRGLARAADRAFPLPTREETRIALELDVYDREKWGNTAVAFRNALEGRHPFQVVGMLHNRVHRWIGDDMEKSSSPNDPVFYLHHSNVDRVWTAWMMKHSDSAYVPDNSESVDLMHHRLDDPMYFPFGESSPSPRRVLDVSDLYRYDTLDDLL